MGVELQFVQVQAAISVGLWHRLIGLSRGDLLTARGGFALGWIRVVVGSGCVGYNCCCYVLLGGEKARSWIEEGRRRRRRRDGEAAICIDFVVER